MPRRESARTRSQPGCTGRRGCFAATAALIPGYVGSSNLSTSVLLDGLEWNVRISGIVTPVLVRKFEATFDSHWNNPEFRSYDHDPQRQAAGPRARIARKFSTRRYAPIATCSPTGRSGSSTSAGKAPAWPHVFASVQSLSTMLAAGQRLPHVDIVVIDESITPRPRPTVGSPMSDGSSLRFRRFRRAGRSRRWRGRPGLPRTRRSAVWCRRPDRRRRVALPSRRARQGAGVQTPGDRPIRADDQWDLLT